MSPPTLRIGPVRVTLVGGETRVSARVGRTDVAFQTSGAGCRAAPEAFGSAFLLPALLRGRGLVLEESVDARWLEGVRRIHEIASAWWGCVAPLPRAPSHVASAPLEADLGATGLCFTSGVDSLHALLAGRTRVDRLVFVHGYDVAIEDEARAEAFVRSLEEIGAVTGTTPVVIRTDLRRHPVMQKVPWPRVFGGALAAAGHLLGASLTRLLIASSYPAHHAVPYGSHPRTDPLYTSSGLQVVHTGNIGWRFEKLRLIADEPLAQRHLRVCWENRSPTGNCSRCEKCLRTLLTLEAIGKRHLFTTFDTRTPLPDLLDALPGIENDVLRAYEIELGRGLSPSLSRAVRDLIGRSRRR